MMNIEPFPVDFRFKWISMNCDTEFGLEKIAHPKIVIADKECGCNAFRSYLIEFGQRAVVAFRDDRSVFNPGVKKVADDVQLIGGGFDMIQKAENSVFLGAIFFPRSESEVDIGHEVCNHLPNNGGWWTLDAGPKITSWLV